MEENKNNAYNSYSDEVEIDLGALLLLFWHYAWLIVLCALLTGAAAFAISKFAVTPLYESTTQVYVINKKDSETALTYNDLQMGTQLTKDYAELIKSRNVLEKVIEKLQMKDSYEELYKRIEVTTPTDGRILAITVTDPNPQMAQKLADEIREVASEHIISVMDTEAMNVVDMANLPAAPASPNVMKWTTLGILLGAFLCMGVLLIRFLMDDTIKNAEDVEKHLGISTLASIPLRDEQDARKEMKRQEKLIQSGMADGIVEVEDLNAEAVSVQKQGVAQEQ